VFGIWAILSYNISVKALTAATHANIIALLQFCYGITDTTDTRFNETCAMILTYGKESLESIAETAGMSGNQPNGDGVDESPNGKLSWLGIIAVIFWVLVIIVGYCGHVSTRRLGH
jgi:hypothetical protein